MKRQLQPDNPFVDLAAFLFLEDIADKQGEAGMSTYLLSLASSLAKSMPEEEFETWEDFLKAMTNGESILSTFEQISTPTKYCICTIKCPYERGMKEYVKRIGKISQQHYNVAEYYNHTVKPGAVSSPCVIHQQFRTIACERIKVAGKKVKYAQVTAKNFDGRLKQAPEEWLPILLEKAGITRTQLNMILRTHDCVYCVYPEQ